MTDLTLLRQAAVSAANNAYAPYSRFHVGAAVLLSDGGVETGANVENASYGMTLCAETVALAKLANAGRLADVRAIAVIGGFIVDGALVANDAPVRPCGRCRQMLNEAAQLGGHDIMVHSIGAHGVDSKPLSVLLPDAFGPADLGLVPKKLETGSDIPLKLRAALQKKKITKKALADVAGIHRMTLDGCENEGWNPKLATLNAIAPFIPE